MNDGLLLDTHTALWLEAAHSIPPKPQAQILVAGTSGKLFLSDISIWEIGVARHKKDTQRRPNLQGLALDQWIERISARYSIKALSISRQIIFEASEVPPTSGYGDPGDCLLIAAARIHHLSLVTRDHRILKLAKDRSGYLSVIPC